MSRRERELAFLRSLYTMPYFTNLNFEILAGAANVTQYQNKIKVNKDFYLTEIQSNLGEIYTTTGSLFNLSIFQGYRESLYRYDINQNFPSSFLTYDARFNTVVAQQIFDDRQRENFPLLIRNGNEIQAVIENLNTKNDPATAYLMLAGWQRDDTNFVDTRTQQKLIDSIEKPIQIDFFKFTVDTDGQQIKFLENDNIPRLILGFAARNSTAEKGSVSTSKILIRDLTRRTAWNNLALPLEFFAPRMTCLLDTHTYWLPTEYFFQPFARLEFDLTNVSPSSVQGYEFTAITRTI